MMRLHSLQFLNQTFRVIIKVFLGENLGQWHDTQDCAPEGEEEDYTEMLPGTGMCVCVGGDPTEHLHCGFQIVKVWLCLNTKWNFQFKHNHNFHYLEAVGSPKVLCRAPYTP